MGERVEGDEDSTVYEISRTKSFMVTATHGFLVFAQDKRLVNQIGAWEVQASLPLQPNTFFSSQFIL